MKHLPRALNRVLLFIGGLLFLVAGIGLVLAASSSSFFSHFHSIHRSISTWYSGLVERSYVNIGGVQNFSWMTIAWVVLAIIVILLMLDWIARQGGGKTRQFSMPDSEGPEGRTVPTVSFVDALLEDAIEGDRWIASTKTTAWDVKGKPGLAIDVNTYKGADPAHLKEVMDRAIARLDSVMGTQIPVRVRFTTNLRARFSSAERVD